MPSSLHLALVLLLALGATACQTRVGREETVTESSTEELPLQEEVRQVLDD